VNQILVLAEVFDRLRQAMASDPQGFCELYRDYLSDAWQTMAALRTACEQGQSVEFGSKAHYLKSSSLVLGIRPVAQYCTQMEEIGRAADFQAASLKVEETGVLLYEVQAELETRLGPEVIPSAA
jgi:HPt (histidine-containing phosphotransfer) domain-containing protein